MSTLDSQTIAYLLTVAVQLCFFIWAFNKQSEVLENERKAWSQERKDLLDRIQAPTFNDYANKVIREKKAEQSEEPQEHIEFIS